MTDVSVIMIIENFARSHIGIVGKVKLCLCVWAQELWAPGFLRCFPSVGLGAGCGAGLRLPTRPKQGQKECAAPSCASSVPPVLPSGVAMGERRN